MPLLPFKRAPMMRDQEIRALLGALGLSGDAVDKPLAVLSGGETKRVALAELLLTDANCLFLDEPTNHLDIPSRESVEEALETYPGTIVMVTHDRYLVDRLADRVLWIEGGRTKLTLGNYTEMRAEAVAKKRAVEQAAKDAAKAARHERADKGSGKGSGKREHKRGRKGKRSGSGQGQGADSGKKRYRQFKGSVQKLEAEIEKRQARLEELTAKMETPEVYDSPEKARDLGFEYTEVEAELAELESDWLDRAS